MRVYTIEARLGGKVVFRGVCSWQCINATDPRCTCACAGLNHGFLNSYGAGGHMKPRRRDDPAMVAGIIQRRVRRRLAAEYKLPNPDNLKVTVTFQDSLIEIMELAAAEAESIEDE